jgi:Putative MetA-pathway of phenol degradation
MTRIRRVFLFVFLGYLTLLSSGNAQIDHTFENLFNEFLVNRLKLSPGMHGNHFIQAAELANQSLVPSLNSLIVSDISSFPLSSTVAGITFDFSRGAPVSTIEGLGPIFSEIGETIGEGRLNVGFGYTHLDLSRLRGLPLNQMRFTFTHVDVTPDDTLGDSSPESDDMDVFMDLHINASIYAFYATVGVTKFLDIGVAVPLLSVNLQGNARAKINSFTYGRFGRALHYFGGDTLNPVLQTTVPYDESSTGLGDVALRIKYNFAHDAGVDIAGLLDVRFPTGKKDDFLGTGKMKAKLSAIISKRFKDLRPHLNIGYELRTADFETDVIDVKAGFDQKLVSGLTFALDALGTFAVDNSKTPQLLPGSRDIYFRVNQVLPGQYIDHVDLSNVPERNNDNQVTLSTGFRYAPTESMVFFVNTLVPLNDGGLTSTITPSMGLSIYL